MFAIPKQAPDEGYSEKYKYQSIYPVNDMNIPGSQLIPDLAGQHYLGYIASQYQQQAGYKYDQPLFYGMIDKGGRCGQPK